VEGEFARNDASGFEEAADDVFGEVALLDFGEADAFGLVVEEFDFVEDDAHGVYEGAGED